MHYEPPPEGTILEARSMLFVKRHGSDKDIGHIYIHTGERALFIKMEEDVCQDEHFDYVTFLLLFEGTVYRYEYKDVPNYCTWQDDWEVLSEYKAA